MKYKVYSIDRDQFLALSSQLGKEDGMILNDKMNWVEPFLWTDDDSAENYTPVFLNDKEINRLEHMIKEGVDDQSSSKLDFTGTILRVIYYLLGLGSEIIFVPFTVDKGVVNVDFVKGFRL